MNLHMRTISHPSVKALVLILEALGSNLHSSCISSETSHTLCLHCRHAQKILHITHVCRQLRKLRVQMRQLSCLRGRSWYGRQAGGIVRLGCAWSARIEGHCCGVGRVGIVYISYGQGCAQFLIYQLQSRGRVLSCKCCLLVRGALFC